jgi:hypothetical protein
LNQLADKAKAEAAGFSLTSEPEPEPFTMDDEPTEAKDPERPALSWGDPSLN